MVSEVVMPQMGADMTEGTLLRWLKEEGDSVERGEVIAEIETDKANIEIEAFESGVFRKALASEGDVVQVGEVIAVVAGSDDDISKYDGAAAGAIKQPIATASAAAERRPDGALAAPSEAATTSAEMPERAPEPAPPAEVQQPQPSVSEAAPRPTNGRVKASPLAKRIADERGVDLGSVRGTGPGGRIVKKDVEQATTGAPAPAPQPAAAQPAARAVERPAAAAASPAAAAPIEMSKMRQTIARRMSQSKREAPHYYLLVDIDMTDAMALRKQINESTTEDERVSVNDLIVRACGIALQRHPAFNVTVDGEQYVRQPLQNVCIAIALDDGLIAPAIIDAGNKRLPAIARESKDLVERTKGGALKVEEVTQGTFSITNLGAYGIETLVGIIQPPQTAILGVGTVMEQPAVRGAQVVVRQMMKVALAADHRVTDGAQGARFLGEIKGLLEKPVSLIV
ncbi:MAG: dihydrolipoamide acetyltransferase family protein [Dehalococcoidia bacterium]